MTVWPRIRRRVMDHSARVGPGPQVGPAPPRRRPGAGPGDRLPGNPRGRPGGHDHSRHTTIAAVSKRGDFASDRLSHEATKPLADNQERLTLSSRDTPTGWNRPAWLAARPRPSLGRDCVAGGPTVHSTHRVVIPVTAGCLEVMFPNGNFDLIALTGSHFLRRPPVLAPGMAHTPAGCLVPGSAAVQRFSYRGPFRTMKVTKQTQPVDINGSLRGT